MNRTTYNTDNQNLNRSQRAQRVIVAVALLAVTVSATSGALGGLSVLPLVAIYPLITGLLGWDPIFDLFGWGAPVSTDGKLSTASRVEFALTGTVLIGSVLLAPASIVSGVTVLALAGVFPMVSALIGEDLLQSAGGVSYRTTHVHYEAQPDVAQSTAVVAAAINDIAGPGRRAA